MADYTVTTNAQQEAAIDMGIPSVLKLKLADATETQLGQVAAILEP